MGGKKELTVEFGAINSDNVEQVSEQLLDYCLVLGLAFCSKAMAHPPPPVPLTV
jgi:hypothetical protein